MGPYFRSRNPTSAWPFTGLPRRRALLGAVFTCLRTARAAEQRAVRPVRGPLGGACDGCDIRLLVPLMVGRGSAGS